MRTVLVEIKPTLNNRPLIYLFDDEQGSLYPLTLRHFATNLSLEDRDTSE